MPSFLTPGGRLKVEKQLKKLEEEMRPQIAERIRAAKEMGDLSENTEYTSAKDEQSLVEEKIARLRNLLRSAEIIDNHQKGGNVSIGSTVKLKTKHGIKKYTIVGKEETDPTNGFISHESPLGQALMDKCKGEEVTIRTPSGPEVIFIIASVD